MNELGYCMCEQTKLGVYRYGFSPRLLEIADSDYLVFKGY